MQTKPMRILHLLTWTHLRDLTIRKRDIEVHKESLWSSFTVAHPLLAGNYPTGKPGGVDNKYNGAGFFVNLNTIWDNRYFLDVIYRYEGSSKFGKNSRFAPFWSVGTGWNIHNEKNTPNTATLHEKTTENQFKNCRIYYDVTTR